MITYIFALLISLAVAGVVWTVAGVLALLPSKRPLAKRLAVGMAFVFPGVFIVQVLCYPVVVVILTFLSVFGRKAAFRAQAEAGQPIVRAIEAYRRDTGQFPASLANLAPKYLPAVPDTLDESRRKWEGWDYRLVNDDAAPSYRLQYDMGLGYVEYDAPNWTGDDEGTVTTIITNR